MANTLSVDCESWQNKANRKVVECMKGPLEIFKAMSDKNNDDLKLAPMSNIKSVKQLKGSFGEITIAIPNECVTDFILGNYVGGLIFCHRSEYDKEKDL